MRQEKFTDAEKLVRARASAQRWRARNPDKLRAAVYSWRQANPAKYKALLARSNAAASARRKNGGQSSLPL